VISRPVDFLGERDRVITSTMSDPGNVC